MEVVCWLGRQVHTAWDTCRSTYKHREACPNVNRRETSENALDETVSFRPLSPPPIQRRLATAMPRAAGDDWEKCNNGAASTVRVYLPLTMTTPAAM